LGIICLIGKFHLSLFSQTVKNMYLLSQSAGIFNFGALLIVICFFVVVFNHYDNLKAEKPKPRKHPNSWRSQLQVRKKTK